MRIRTVLILVAPLLGFAGPALAACPPPAVGNTAAEMRQNQERIVCLQSQVSARSEILRQQQALDAINERLRALELRQQMQRIEVTPPPVIVIPRPNP